MIMISDFKEQLMHQLMRRRAGHDPGRLARMTKEGEKYQQETGKNVKRCDWNLVLPFSGERTQFSIDGFSDSTGSM
jgi:hypothetical protein